MRQLKICCPFLSVIFRHLHLCQKIWSRWRVCCTKRENYRQEHKLRVWFLALAFGLQSPRSQSAQAIKVLPTEYRDWGAWAAHSHMSKQWFVPAARWGFFMARILVWELSESTLGWYHANHLAVWVKKSQHLCLCLGGIYWYGAMVELAATSWVPGLPVLCGKRWMLQNGWHISYCL